MIAFILAVIGSVLVHAASPPDDIILISPFLNVVYQVNSTVPIGMITASVEGMQQSVYTSILLPNKTVIPFIGAETAVCQSSYITENSTFYLDQPGTYTIFWNLTYGYTFNATADSCGNSIFSYDNWVLNETFSVSATNGLEASGAMTTTAALPSAPTGTVIAVSSIGAAVPAAASVPIAGVVGAVLLPLAALILLL